MSTDARPRRGEGGPGKCGRERSKKQGGRTRRPYRLLTKHFIFCFPNNKKVHHLRDQKAVLNRVCVCVSLCVCLSVCLSVLCVKKAVTVTDTHQGGFCLSLLGTGVRYSFYGVLALTAFNSGFPITDGLVLCLILIITQVLSLTFGPL